MSIPDDAHRTPSSQRVADVDFGYVGLPLALASARRLPGSLGFGVVPDIMAEFTSFGLIALVHDPMADAAGARHEYSFELQPWEALANLDAIVLTVAQRNYPPDARANVTGMLRPDGIVIDVNAALDPAGLPIGLEHWSL